MGPLVNILRRIHGHKDAVAQRRRGQGQRQTDAYAQPHAAGYVPAQFLMVARAELLRYRDGEAAADAAAEPHHQEVDGPGGAHRRQGRAAQRLSNNGAVHHVVQLLEQVPEQDRQPEAQNLRHRTALRQVFRHSDHLTNTGCCSFFPFCPQGSMPWKLC